MGLVSNPRPFLNVLILRSCATTRTAPGSRNPTWTRRGRGERGLQAPEMRGVGRHGICLGVEARAGKNPSKATRVWTSKLLY